jgi:hypothetical protein
MWRASLGRLRRAPALLQEVHQGDRDVSFVERRDLLTLRIGVGGGADMRPRLEKGCFVPAVLLS